MIRSTEREGSTHALDEEINARIESAIAANGFPMRDILEAFPLYVRRVHLARFLARYELFRMVRDRPGSIFECGVYRGSGLMTWAKILETVAPGDRMRRVVGFDNFAGITHLHEEDGAPMERRSKVVGGWDSSGFVEELEAHIGIFHDDSYVPRAPRIELVKGDLAETAPGYVERNSGVRVALLNIDMDVYEPTLAALRHFYPLVVPGGVVVLDEYGVDAWGGEARAFERYFEECGTAPPPLRKLGLYSLPGAYFIKE